ncbi:MAG: nucleoside triphosphate pyrophosphohydrolase [Chloroflexota bacterium]
METASAHGCLTIVGLGPGTWESLTVEAATVLQKAAIVYAGTTAHLFLQALRSHVPSLDVRACGDLYAADSSDTTDPVRFAGAVVARVEAGEDLVFAVPFGPSRSDPTVRRLLDLVDSRNVPVHLVPAVGFVDAVLRAIGMHDDAQLEVLDAAEIDLFAAEDAVGAVPGHAPALPWRAPVPTSPLVVSRLHDPRTAASVQRWLGRFYPGEHPVRLVHLGQSTRAEVSDMRLASLDEVQDIDDTTALFVPPLDDMDNVRTFAGLMQLTRRLRAPGGCPWDREQTHASLKPHLLEETYEVLDALDSGQASVIAEEFGDLLYQIAIHSQVAAETGEFTVEDVIENIVCKLIGRHPHVFGDLNLSDSQDVLRNWESFKQREKPRRASVLEQIPRGLPALPQSNLMQKRAAGVGFEWPRLHDVLDKVREELAELELDVDAGAGKDEQREEYGDILFALVSVARHLRLDPEEALRLANRKFAARFQYVEGRVGALNKTLRDLSSEELDTYWQEAKALGTTRHAEIAES